METRPSNQASKRARWLFRLGVGVFFALFLAAGLWGIKSPFIWGHYGYHAGFHTANARMLLRYGIWTPAQYAGHAPPPPRTYYLHHPILMHPYLAAAMKVFGQHEWLVRAVPLTFSLLALLVVAWLAARFFGPLEGVLAAGVFAFLPQNLIFCHLIDHETPGLLYTLLSGGLLVFALEGTGAEGDRPSTARRRVLFAAGAVLFAALAGLTDWPPYQILFFVGLYAAGLLTAQIPGADLGRKVVPCGLPGTAVCLGLAYGVFHYFETKLGLPKEIRLGFAAAAVFLTATGLQALAPPDRPGAWPEKGAKKAAATAAILLVWGMALLAVLAFHVWYTKHVGAWHDLKHAFSHRSHGAISKGYWKHYKEEILYLMFTKPVVWLGWVWLAVYPLRLLWGKMRGAHALAFAFAAGQVLHNLKFPNEIAMHNYRGYYLAGFFPLAAADLLHVVSGWVQGLAARLERRMGTAPAEGTGPSSPAQADGAPTGRLLALTLRALPWLVAGGLAAGLLTMEAKKAWTPWRKSRKMGGTITFKHYRSYRHEILFFRQVHRDTTPDTFVFIHTSLAPRFDAYYYLDRDYHKVAVLPPDLDHARRKAAYHFARERRPRQRRHYYFPSWMQRDLGALGRVAYKLSHPRPVTPKPIRALDRPMVAVARLDNGKALRQVARLAQKYAVVVYHPFVEVFYDRKGPSLRAYRFVVRPLRGLEAYLQWRKKELVFVRDHGLERYWKRRFAKALEAPPRKPRRPRRLQRPHGPIRPSRGGRPGRPELKSRMPVPPELFLPMAPIPVALPGTQAAPRTGPRPPRSRKRPRSRKQPRSARP